MELENLPEIVLLKIIKFTDLESKLKLMQTSRFYYKFIAENPELCKFLLFWARP